MFADAREHLAQKRFEIVPVELRAAEQAIKRRRALAAAIAAGEEKVLAPQRHTAQRAFCGVVVDLDSPVVAISLQRTPTSQRISNGFGGRRFLRERFERLLQPDVHRLEQRAAAFLAYRTPLV